jgi:hypothetical protein
MKFHGTTFHNPSQDETPALVADAARAIWSADVYNPGNATAYLQIFDASDPDDVVLGSTEPRWVLPVPAGGGNAPAYPTPLGFDYGIVVAATSTPDGAGAPASALVLSIQHGRVM